jgi:hypothetical protein
MSLFCRFFIIISILYFHQNADAQSVSYYPFENAQQLSIAINPTKVFWMDFRFQMNSFTSSLNTETALMVNVAYSRNANFYVGGGTNMGIIGAFYDRKLINGYFGSFGVRAYPFEKASKVSINFETGPFVDADGKSGKFRAWLGVGYHFGGK